MCMGAWMPGCWMALVNHSAKARDKLVDVCPPLLALQDLRVLGEQR